MMTTTQLKAILWQCTKINFSFLLFTFVVLLLADLLYDGDLQAILAVF